MFKLPRIRFTIRQLMLATAFAGIASGMEVTALRLQSMSRNLDGKAREHQTAEQLFANEASINKQWRVYWSRLAASEEVQQSTASAQLHRSYEQQCLDEMNRTLRVAKYHAALKEKYTAAARSPWSVVGPDPPEPE